MSIDTRLLKIGAQIKLKRSWKLNQPIPLAEVEAIESKYGFQLPEEYKSFITKIGNGSSLPPFREESCQLYPFKDGHQLNRLHEDFPLIENWEWDTDPEFCMDDPEDSEKWKRVQENGVLVLVEENVEGGQTWFLIVSGPRRGEVWERDESGVLRLPGCTFLDWVELYLSKKLTSYTDQLFREEKERQKAGDPLARIRGLMAGKRRRDISWNPPISLEAVRDFERRHGIALPEEYVTFITEIANGCENFPAVNSCGKGGVFFSLEQLDCLPNLGKPFYFTENTDETRRSLTNCFGPNAYTGKNPVWHSLFKDFPREDPISPVWICEDYSVLCGALPFATYNDDRPNWNMRATQPILIVTGPLQGQVWRSCSAQLRPDGMSFYQWILQMLEGGAR